MWRLSLTCFALLEFASLSQCITNFSEDFVSQFDVRTAYRNAEVGSSAIPSRCEFVALFMMRRHGTRLPSASEIEKINALIRAVKANGTGAISGRIKNWTNPFANVTPGALVDVGINESMAIDDYLRNELNLKSKLNASNVKFYSSTSQRVIDSALAAAKAFGVERKAIITDNTATRFYDSCPKYVKGVLNNRTALHEHHKFAANPRLTSIVSKVKGSLGLPENNSFDLDQLMTLHGICKYDTAVTEGVPYSPWCSVFTQSAIAVLEFYEDLKYYYLSSYGHSINYLQSCPMVSNMLSLMNDVIGGSTKTRGIFNFGHVTGLLSFATNLGIIERSQVPPRADNYESQKNRKFRTSNICPFAGNLALLLLNCSNSSSYHGLQIMPLLNQNNITWSLCNSSLCPFDSVVKKLKFCASPAYQYETLCKHSTSASPITLMPTMLLVFLGVWRFSVA